MRLTYPGNVTQGIIGRIFVHQTDVYEAVRAEYAPLADRTIVEFERVWSSDERSAIPDAFGELRLDV